MTTVTNTASETVVASSESAQPTALGRKSYKLSRYDLLDIARGVASVMVIFFHRYYPYPESPVVDLFSRFYVGVQIFFVISGFVIYQAAERQFVNGNTGAMRFLRNRIRRIYPPMLTALFVAIVVLAINGYLFHPVVILTNATLTYPFFGHHDIVTPYWTLAVEQQFYVVMFLIILPVFNKIRMPLILLSTVIGFLDVTQIVPLGDLKTKLLSASWYEFSLGILAYWILSRQGDQRVIRIIFAVLIVAGFFGDFPDIVAAVFGVFVLVAYRFDAPLQGIRLLDPLRWLGKLSYSLYLVHIPMFNLVDHYLEPTDSNPFVLYFAGIIAAFAAAVALHVLVERHFIGSRSVTSPP